MCCITTNMFSWPQQKYRVLNHTTHEWLDITHFTTQDDAYEFRKAILAHLYLIKRHGYIWAYCFSMLPTNSWLPTDTIDVYNIADAKKSHKYKHCHYHRITNATKKTN